MTSPFTPNIGVSSLKRMIALKIRIGKGVVLLFKALFIEGRGKGKTRNLNFKTRIST